MHSSRGGCPRASALAWHLAWPGLAWLWDQRLRRCSRRVADGQTVLVCSQPQPLLGPAVLDPAEVERLRDYKNTPIDMFERKGGAFYPGAWQPPLQVLLPCSHAEARWLR